MNTTLKRTLIAVGLLALLGAAFAWKKVMAPTDIAFLNFMDFQFSTIAEANTSRHVRLHRLAYEQGEMPKLTGYDVVYFFAHGGVNLDEHQLSVLDEAKEAGVKVHAFAPGGEEISNLEPDQLERVGAYFTNGGKKNYRELMKYSRTELHGRKFGSEEAAEPYVFPETYYYALEEEIQVFETLAEFEKYREGRGWAKPGAPKVALASMLSGSEFLEPLVSSLQERGMSVYPIGGWAKRLDYVKELGPDLVIHIAHGRLARTAAPAWFEEANVPSLSPLLVFAPHEDWLADQQGLVGGMLSQGVVMPEIDGSTSPYVVAAQFPNDKGLQVFEGIDDRVESFADRVQKMIGLKTTPNADKKIAVFYYKGAGKNAMVAEGLEIAPSLQVLLERLKAEGYTTGELPANAGALLERIEREGVLLGSYAAGAVEDYWENGNPQWVTPDDYQTWREDCLETPMIEDMDRHYGSVLESHMTRVKDGAAALAIPRLVFGNVALIPVPAAGEGEDSSKLQHGVKVPPPHPYVAAYLWASQNTGGGFGADALVHFGTHGSVEFTPSKQIALSASDWPEALMANTPHFYLYSISNVGEALIAKRRTYATMMTHVTPPFDQGEVYGEVEQLDDKFEQYWNTEDPALKAEYRNSAIELVVSTDVHKDVGIEGFSPETVTDEELLLIHHYLHEVEQAKINTGLHVLGRAYDSDELDNTLKMMAVDYLAYNRAHMDEVAGRATADQIHDAHFFEDHYRDPALGMIEKLVAGRARPKEFIAAADQAILTRAAEHEASRAAQARGRGRGRPGGGSHGSSEKARAPATGVDSPEYLAALKSYSETLESILEYRAALQLSPTAEVDNIVNALGGGFVPPQSGGDPVVNPRAVPSGRNTYGIDAEKTPTEEAWKVGQKLAKALIDQKLADTGAYPEKVAFSLWSSEFVRQEGITIAEILYLLGVEPVRNHRGTVHAVRLIPMEKLQRPRIDVVVQTSGQFRDLGASRLYLINEAVRLASAAEDDGNHDNFVREGSLAAERVMKENGVAPAEAQELADIRVFGGLNGNYGTAIMGMVEDGDSWESEDEVARRYIDNMGAMYDEGRWAAYTPGAFEAALTGTDTIVQPRSSNAWGPLSLDHVYEFMGGLSNASRLVNGTSPQAYFSDLRSPSNPRVQGAREAIWHETRTTLLNPKYITGLMEDGGASSAEVFAETFRNTYGWDVMKSEEIDTEIWDQLNEVYVEDRHELDVRSFFERENPYALQEMTAVMLETVRKGYWAPGEEVERRIAELHAELVVEHDAGCSEFVCDNAKLRAAIAARLDSESARAYQQKVDDVRVGTARESLEGLELQRDDASMATIVSRNLPTLAVLLAIVVAVMTAVGVGASRRRRSAA
ncbi:MAG: cobaltochelatase subunit CobN [Acidobacteriota bacterium]